MLVKKNFCVPRPEAVPAKNLASKLCERRFFEAPEPELPEPKSNPDRIANKPKSTIIFRYSNW